MAGTPRAREGQVKLQWGKLAECEPNLVACWGPGAGSSDADLLVGVVTSRSFSPDSAQWNRSFKDELERRGFDIRTLKISVEKKREEEPA